MMAGSIGFTLNDILHYFSLKDGKVVYTEIVTYFKHALSDPSTQGKFAVSLIMTLLKIGFCVFS